MHILVHTHAYTHVPYAVLHLDQGVLYIARFDHVYVFACGSMSFPATGMESANPKDVAKMLNTKHEDNYMVS